MTPEQLELERQAFEAWYNDLKGFGSLERVGDTYAYSHADYAWQAWQARAQQSAWISVEDRQPETETTVLICTKRGDIFSSWASNEDVFWFYGEEEDNRVTHWQPLPEPPKAA